MDLLTMQDFFLWGFIVNIAIYLFQMLLSLGLRGYMVRTHSKLFGITEETIRKSLYLYFAIYKLILISFFLAPWIAILIIK